MTEDSSRAVLAAASALPVAALRASIVTAQAIFFHQAGKYVAA
jgi:vacuolar-type H+-ATPase catalytic subunit A/Vma1